MRRKHFPLAEGPLGIGWQVLAWPADFQSNHGQAEDGQSGLEANRRSEMSDRDHGHVSLEPADQASSFNIYLGVLTALFGAA